MCRDLLVHKGCVLMSLSYQTRECSKGLWEEWGEFFSFAIKRVCISSPRGRFRKTIFISYQFQAGNNSFIKWWLLSLLYLTFHRLLLDYLIWSLQELWVVEHVLISVWHEETVAQRAVKLKALFKVMKPKVPGLLPSSYTRWPSL